MASLDSLLGGGGGGARLARLSKQTLAAWCRFYVSFSRSVFRAPFPPNPSRFLRDFSKCHEASRREERVGGKFGVLFRKRDSMHRHRWIGSTLSLCTCCWRQIDCRESPLGLQLSCPRFAGAYFAPPVSQSVSQLAAARLPVAANGTQIISGSEPTPSPSPSQTMTHLCLQINGSQLIYKCARLYCARARFDLPGDRFRGRCASPPSLEECANVMGWTFLARIGAVVDVVVAGDISLMPIKYSNLRARARSI